MSCFSNMLRLFNLYIIFNIHYSFHGTSAMIGKDVRLANLGEFPFMVALSQAIAENFEEKEKGQFCGGALITNRHVLTAAHCLRNKQLNSIVVKIGSIDLRNANAYQIKWWLTYSQWANPAVPPGHNADVVYDIAILKIRGTIKDIQIPTISYTPDADLYGGAAVTGGWGLMEDDKKARYMRIGIVAVLAPENCAPFILERDIYLKELLPKLNLCTSSASAVTLGCGDSGSPLLRGDNNIIGVNVVRCKPVSPNVTLSQYRHFHSSVNSYSQFIETVKRK